MRIVITFGDKKLDLSEAEALELRRLLGEVFAADNERFFQGWPPVLTSQSRIEFFDDEEVTP